MTEPSKWRQQWAQAVRKASSLNVTARLVGHSLALDFANKDTGQCNPSRATLAAHLGVSEATIKRAICDLTKGGWLSKSTTTARKRTADYTFLIPGKSRGKVVQFPSKTAENAGQKRPAIDAGTGVKSDSNAGQICAAPYKGRNQVKNQDAREQASEVASPVWQSALIEPGSYRESAWNEWLAENGWPSVAELDVPYSDESDVGWRMPFALPPGEAESIQARITEKYLNWANARMIKREEGRA